MPNIIYLCYKKEYRYRNIVSSHRTSDGFKYTVQDEEEVFGPYISKLSFTPTYQDAVMISNIITKSKGTTITYFDDDWWAENFCSPAQENRTECIGDLNVCKELNRLLSEKYDISFISDDSGRMCTLDFLKEITPIIGSLDNCLKNACNNYAEQLSNYDRQISACYEQIEEIRKEQDSFIKDKNSYIIKNSHSVFRNLVFSNRIEPNEKVSALYEEYPLDIALICGDKELYLYLIEHGALNTCKEYNIDYALQDSNLAALKKTLSLGGNFDYASTYTFEPVKGFGDIIIKSIFDFFGNLPLEFAKSFFKQKPEPITYYGVTLSSKDIQLLQLIFYRRFSYDWDARKRDDIYYFDPMFKELFMRGISKEFKDVEPTLSNCHTFKLFCQFYRRSSDCGTAINEDNSDRYESNIDFDSILECCIIFKDYEYVKLHFSKKAIKKYLHKVIELNFDKDIKNKYLNKEHLGDDFYNYLIEIYKNDSIKMDYT